MGTIRRCREQEQPEILAIINAAAQVYRGVIPADRWHDPYMSDGELRREIDAGVVFWGYADERDALLGVMGIQPVQDVELIRHAYVRPDRQSSGIGVSLIEQLRRQSSRPMLVGTWAAAEWAIRFYQKRGFELVAADRAGALLEKYWSLPQRQIETSVVLADPAFRQADRAQ